MQHLVDALTIGQQDQQVAAAFQAEASLASAGLQSQAQARTQTTIQLIGILIGGATLLYFVMGVSHGRR